MARADAGPEWSTACTNGQLALAPILDRDRANDDSKLTYKPNSSGIRVPVVMVHGWTGSSVHDDSMKGTFSHTVDLTQLRENTQPSIRTLIGNIQEIPGTVAYTFDYYDKSALWVTDPSIGPALATALKCLSEKSGQKPIVVAHSMGGLATREALQTDPSLVGALSQVITFGTPNTGSDIAAYIKSSDPKVLLTRSPGYSMIAAVVNSITSACTEASKSLDSSTCAGLTNGLRAFGGSGAAGLATGSSQLSALLKWPSTLPVHALAGDVKFNARYGSILGLPLSEFPSSGGDLIVPTSSATAGSTTKDIATCKVSLNVAQQSGETVAEKLHLISTDEAGRSILEGTSIPCFHANLMRVQQLANSMLGYINDDVQSRFVGTETIKINPWNDTGGPKIASSLTGGDCIAGSVANRADTFRCFSGNGVYDPCIAKPGSHDTFACLGSSPSSWVLLNGIHEDPAGPRTTDPNRAPFYMELANGMKCHLSIGGGPRTPPGYDFWSGACTNDGSSYPYVLWSNSPNIAKFGNIVYEGKSPRGYWQVAVGTEGSTPQLVEVLRAYR
ncbi:hypothetical protein GCM10009825_38820 [Arthrobacter humicola]|uniref:AB hydrolase-1 domain-containing protein n=1 Tax=Arthrobacter humicola TaxID=409291 RepID=A0ABN2ZQY7_9MICC